MDSLEALNRQITGAQDLAAAQLQGAGAVREVEARLRAETETLKVRAEADADYTRIVEVLTTRYVALAEAQALARSNAAELGQQQQLETLRTEAQLVGATVAQRERELAVLRERQKLTQEGVTDGAAHVLRNLDGVFGRPFHPRRRVAEAASHLCVQGQVHDLEIGRVGQGSRPLVLELDIGLFQPLATTHQCDFGAGGPGPGQGLKGYFGADAGGIPEGQHQSGWIYAWVELMGRGGIHGEMVFAGMFAVVVGEGLSAGLANSPLGQDGRGSPSTHRQA
jgi:hypothetical protein